MVHFKLENKKPVECPHDEWNEWIACADCIVGVESRNDILVSTLFLGVSSGPGKDGRHYVFETMVKGGDHHDHIERYATWEDAESGHDRILEMVFGEKQS